MKRLPIKTVVREALQIVWCKRARLFQALISTGLVLVALDMRPSYLSVEDWRLDTLLAVANIVVFTLFAITCHRIVLLDQAETPKYGIRSWSQRETRFLGWTVVGYFFFSLISMALAMFAGIAAAIIPADEAPPTLWYLFLFPGSYVFARLAVLLPATAIDERHDMKWAWETTSNNGWRLVVVVALLPWLLASAFDFLTIGESLLLEFILHTVAYALMAIEIAVLSVSFQFLAPTDSTESPANIAFQPAAESGG